MKYKNESDHFYFMTDLKLHDFTHLLSYQI